MNRRVPSIDMTRRHFFSKSARGLGTIALAKLLGDDMGLAESSAAPGLPGVPHFAAKAKNVIFLFQALPGI